MPVRNDKLVKRSFKASDGYVKKFGIQGVAFLPGPQPYMWYAEGLVKTYNEAGKRACETPDRTFYDAIRNKIQEKRAAGF